MRAILSLVLLLIGLAPAAAQSGSSLGPCSSPNYYSGQFHSGCLSATDLNNNNTAIYAAIAASGSTGQYLPITGGTLTGALIGTTGAFTGLLTAQTPSPGTSNTTVATTAFVATTFAPKANPTFTGTVTVPTPDPGDNTTKAASTAFVAAAGYAPLASPVFSGTPTAPTASPGTATAQIATTDFVSSSFAPKASPTFTGTATFSGIIVVPTQTAGDSSTKAASTAFVATSFAPKASPSFTGTVTSAGNLTLSGSSTATATITAKSLQILNPNTITMSGTANAATVVRASIGVGGVNGATQGSLNLLTATDAGNYYGPNTLNLLDVQDSYGGAGSAGNRVAVRGFVQSTANAVDPGAAAQDNPGLAAVKGTAQFGISQHGIVRSTDSSAGSIFGANFQGSLTGGSGFHALNGAEFNVRAVTGTTVSSKRGIAVVQTNGDAVRGTYVDVGLTFNNQTSAATTWTTGIEFGGVTADYPMASDSTLFRVTRRRYSSTGTAPFLYGVDFREATITSGGAAFASPNFSVTDTGAAFANGITTNSIVQAQTATLTALVATNGGVYTAKPTITLSAPPSGGTQATATVATMGGASLLGFGNTGRGYTNGETVTPSGGTGAAPTFTATTDGSGRITALALLSNGSWTAAPSRATPTTLTGATSGATSGSINITAYTNSAGTFVPSAWEFGASGDGLSIGSILVVQGDTGTATQFTVDTVTADGGVITAHVTTVGSLTALAGTTYHATDIGNASLLIGYTILTTTISNAGAGYLPQPPPTAILTPTIYLAAVLTPTMTPAAATLSFQPSGGALRFGAGGWTANGSVATSMTSLGPSGAHTTIQEWFTVTNSSGVVRYIPSY